MSNVIHSQKNVAGGVQFRIWSTNTDRYLTDEMDEKELREWLLKEALCEAVTSHLREVDLRLKRAIIFGTSSEVEPPRKLGGPWDKERKR